MRSLTVVFILSAALASCDEGGTTTTPTTEPSPRATTGSTETATPTPTTSPEPSPSPRPIPPAWASPIDEDLDPEALPDDALVPPDAQLTDRLTLPAASGIPDGVAVAYVLGADPFAAEHGFALWQRFDEAPAWSVVFALVDPPREGILGIRLEAGDLTGDGHTEVLAFEDRGGTGACGTWRVIAPAPAAATEIFRRTTCDTQIRIAGEVLEVREAVYEPGDPHCCPSAFRRSTLLWNGSRFRQIASRIEPAAA
ncbi:MAG: hypothetical protein WD965_09665 [Actinomycetota bacterium]